jgi:hypothetical protein
VHHLGRNLRKKNFFIRLSLLALCFFGGVIVVGVMTNTLEIDKISDTSTFSSSRRDSFLDLFLFPMSV